MKKYYNVTFRYSESVFCANIAIATSADAVKEYYTGKGYSSITVTEASTYDVSEAKRRGKPIIQI